MHSRIFSFCAFTIASLPFLSSATDRLVNTRLLQEAYLSSGTPLTIDLKAYFQVYSGTEPSVRFEIYLPEVVGSRLMYTTTTGAVRQGRFVPDRSPQAETNSLQAYDVKASSGVSESYDSPFAILPGDLEWQKQTFVFKLLPESAPLTVANFMTYANDGQYGNLHVHWANNTDFTIIQTGKYRVNPNLDPVWLEEVPTYPPVPLEAGLPLTQGTLALARSVSDPHSGKSQFFFNLKDHSNLVTQMGVNWTDQYAVFASLIEGDLNLLNTIVNAINLSFKDPAYADHIPPGFTNWYPAPAITPYWDISPDNWFYFSHVSVSAGSTAGISYGYEFLDGGNANSFQVNLTNQSILNVSAVDTGTATLRIHATKDNLPTVYTDIKFISAPEEVLGLWATSTIADNGWLGSWYGWLTMKSFPYVNHTDHAFQYISPSSEEDRFFIYDLEYGVSPEKDSLGWFFTNDSLYPWIYVYGKSIWLRHLQGSSKFNGARWFYSSNGEWITDYRLLN